jgi:gliding motility-associated protein GldC
MKHTSNISIDVMLDEDRIPENISWRATDSTADTVQSAKAMMLAFWDGADKSALRIDLWTKTMMVDEMADFYYQVFMTMADTFQRATNQPDLTNEMKAYAADFIKKFRSLQLQQNKEQ